MSIPHEVAKWRSMGLTNAEIRRCLTVTQTERHNRAVNRANTPKRGLDYERMQSQRNAMAATLLEAMAEAVRPYAPEAP